MAGAEPLPAAEAAPRWRAVVVLGAGRSGTSAVTRGLQALEVDLGDRLRPGGGKNPTGFFEDRDLLRINKRLKRALGIRGDSVRLIEPECWETSEVRTLHDEAVETIRRRFGETSLWGYKYGRTLRMLPFWEGVFRALDLDVAYLVAARNPLSVARSRARIDPRRGAQEQSDLEWLVNVIPYFREVRRRRFVVADYDLVMADPRGQLERVADALDLPRSPSVERSLSAYAEGFLRAGMRHSRFTVEDLDRNGRVNALVRDAYCWIYRLATDDVASDDVELWRDWQRIEDALAAMAPVLRRIDEVEAELRRVRRNPISPLQEIPRLWRLLTRG
ncbi:MAG: sulfotransferase family protein [Alphaproteobacteria bacterium]